MNSTYAEDYQSSSTGDSLILTYEYLFLHSILMHQLNLS